MAFRYITTTLPYVNASPHIGFAYEIVAADTFARHYRTLKDAVFFNTGTDEHGQKIYEAAQKNGEDVHAYVDRYAKEFEKLREALTISNDAFIRTTDDKHIEAAQEMWKRAEAAGDIYTKTYKGLYCVGCELFLTEKDLVDGVCTIHGKPPIELEEENYFFAFSKYEERLKAMLSQEGVVVPEFRRKELLTFLDQGLEDFSISRSKERMPWGIPVPGDDTQVMYVWFDALTNYISTLAWPGGEHFKKFWEEGYTVQVAGKDQLRFQSLIWQAMLMSVNEKTTDRIFYHGFINIEGVKMSKSLGNVITPYELVEKYGTEATRYLLLRHIHPFDDTDVSWKKFDEWYTAHLVHGLGNLVARVMKLAEDFLPEPVRLSDTDTRIEDVFSKLISEFRFSDAGDLVWEYIGKADEYMTTREPFKKIKNPEMEKEARDDIETMVRRIAGIAAHLASYMPSTSAVIFNAIQENKKPDNLFPRLL